MYASPGLLYYFLPLPEFTISIRGLEIFFFNLDNIILLILHMLFLPALHIEWVLGLLTEDTSPEPNARLLLEKHETV